MRLLLLCLVLLIGCGPVMLGEEPAAWLGDAGALRDAAMIDDAPSGGSSGSSGSGQPSADPPRPVVIVHFLPLDCGRCFDLQAAGAGGTPPYMFEWEDGSLRAQRTVCVETADAQLSVVVRDADGVRSDAQLIRLASPSDAGCPSEPPSDAAVASSLCLDNPSFEGAPALNLGGAGEFDADPWSACTNPVVSNTPDIANESIAVTDVPPPTDGLTYLALGEGEQASQELCSEVPGGSLVPIAFDLARVDIGEPVVENVFLEIWGGLAADCSQRQLLWASPALDTGWQSFCVTLRPQHFMTQLTLRANADMTSLSPAYLFVDNLRPVASCP
jgi:hypothetical protein